MQQVRQQTQFRSEPLCGRHSCRAHRPATAPRHPRLARHALQPICALSAHDGGSEQLGADLKQQTPIRRLSSSLLRALPWSPSFLQRSSTFVKAAGSDARAPSGSDDGVGGSGGGQGGGGGGDGEGDGEDESNNEEKVLSLKQVEALSKERGVSLPSDMLEIAAKYGLRLSAFETYLALQGGLLTGFLARSAPYFRDRMMADKMFLFKVGVEVLIDSGCATVAEVRKRGDDFWNEFEFYMSDLLVGLVMDVVLVSLMTPAAVLGGGSKASMSTSWLQKQLAKVPTAVFEASVPGTKEFSIGNRLACLLVKFGEYSLAGFSCGLIGQGIANALINLKRSIHGKSDDDVAVPPLLKTALVWGLFMGVSSNLRYQAVFGLERMVDMTIARKVPQVAYGTTVGIRFMNNIIGGENFIDMARWAGVQ